MLPSPTAAPEPQRPASPSGFQPSSAKGAGIFSDRAFGPAKIACADCHSIADPNEPAPAGDRIRPGHTLHDAFGRGSWWNGRVTTDAGDAAAVCHTRFQGADGELPPEARVSIVLFLKDHSAPVSGPISIARASASTAEINQGDAARGAAAYQRACAWCHEGKDASGGDLRSSRLSPHEIAQLVREGKGRMPFFQPDVLPDPQLADIAAYTWSLQPK
jgi:mono/diheme cytochrome c family protein